MSVSRIDAVNRAKFYGRFDIVQATDPLTAELIPQLLTAVDEVESGGEVWRSASKEIQEFTNRLLSQQAPFHRYQLEIMRNVVLPYVSKLRGRYHTDHTRASQVHAILSALSLPEDVHPAISLNLIEHVRYELSHSRSTFFFKSELLTLLTNELNVQWAPILNDMRVFLYDLGGKLTAIAVITIIGWPMVFLAPLLLYTRKILLMVKEFEQQHYLSRQSVFEVVKIVLIMLALSQLMSIITMYSSIGYLCGTGAVLSIAIASNKELMKAAVPFVAPNARLLDEIMTGVSRMDISAVSTAIRQDHHGQAQAASVPDYDGVPRVDARVEELPDDPRMIVPAAATVQRTSTTGSSRGRPIEVKAEAYDEDWERFEEVEEDEGPRLRRSSRRK